MLRIETFGAGLIGKSPLNVAGYKTLTIRAPFVSQEEMFPSEGALE